MTSLGSTKSSWQYGIHYAAHAFRNLFLPSLAPRLQIDWGRLQPVVGAIAVWW